MTQAPQAVLLTERLQLRPLQMSDAPTIQQLANDWDVAKTLATMPHPYEDGMAEAFLSEVTQYQEHHKVFGIVRQADDQLLGVISIGRHAHDNRAEIGYWLGRDFWGQGYMSEAARAVVDFGFRVMGLHRVYATYYVTNPASRRVMEKAGMCYEGMMREHIARASRDNQSKVYHDVGVCGILRREWQAQQQQS